MTYILLGVLGVLSITLLVMSSKLFFNARGSLLYSTVSIVGLLSVISGGLFIASNLMEFESTLYFSILFSLLNISLYSLWKITYNQIDKKLYSSLLYLVMMLSLGTDYLVSIDHQLVSGLIKIISEYQIINSIIMIFIIIKYFQFSRMNNTYELNFIPIVLLLYLLSEFCVLLVSGHLVIIFSIVKVLAILFLLVFYTKDYKNSFYY